MRSSEVSGENPLSRHTYVIDRDYHVVYMDEAARRMFPTGQVGARCYESFRGAGEPCEDCAWRRDQADGVAQTVIFSARRDLWFEITCLEIDWFDRGPCVLFSGRPVGNQSKSLFTTLSEPSSYDELFELNFTANSYKVLYSEPDKYVMPALEGVLDEMLADVADRMIAPEDHDRFLAFWDFGTLGARIDEAGGALQDRFRKLRCDGSWGWASQTAVPVKRGGKGEVVMMCFISDIDRDMREREAAVEDAQIRRLMERDQLTGLYNAGTFYDKAGELLAANPGQPFEAVYLDLEHFKLFNEWHGREAGDEMLRAIAESLTAIVQRFGGAAGYLGGDDFALVLPSGIVTEEAIERQLKVAPFDSENAIGFQPAVGVCAIDTGNDAVIGACDHAMIAMASVKGTYTKRLARYEKSMAEELENETKTLLEVRQALENHEFVLHWQPQCSTRTGRIVGLEALVRWQHPERGLVMPGAFIPVLERNGFIASLDLYVWDEVCRHLRSWIDRGNRPIPVSVNISRADLYAIDVPDALEELIERYGIDRNLLQLEITESAYAEDERMTEAVEHLRALGFTILMDDFGSGYSSLNMLKDITVDVLKIDMGFLTRESDSQRSESILEAVVSMARLMDLRIIAEGAETKEQVEFLQDIACDYAQGYYFHRPMGTEAVEKLLAQDGIVDYRGILSPALNAIDIDQLVRKDETSRSIIDNLIGGMAVYAAYDDRFELLQVNNEYFRVTGCNPVDLKERQSTIWKQVHPEDLPTAMALFDYAEKHPVSGAEGVVRRYRLSGEVMWMKLRLFFLRAQDDRRLYYASVEDVTAQKQREFELEDLAVHDALTGLVNRAAASERLTQEFAETVGTGKTGAFVIVDLDDFKSVNDRFGHLYGDTVLSGIGSHLSRAFRKQDLISRWGGDEFIVYCNDMSREDALQRVGDLCSSHWNACTEFGQEVSLTVSAGIALVPAHGTDFETVCAHADVALYQAKQAGKSSFFLYDESMEKPASPR